MAVEQHNGTQDAQQPPPPPPQQSNEMDVEDKDAAVDQAETTTSSSPRPSLKKPLNKMKVVELRDELRKRGLETNGLKTDLVERLKQALEQ